MHCTRGGQIDVIYNDFEKALDQVLQKQQTNSSSSQKVNSKLVEWIDSFLFNRRLIGN
jgi:hypothetical protein